MIGAVALWLRRGTPARAFPVLVAMELALLFTRGGWGHEWDWAFSYASLGLSVIGPLVAGLIAHDRARRAEPSIALLARTASRGRAGLVAIGAAGGLCALGVWLVGIVVAGAIAVGDASGVPNPWVFVESLALTAVFATAGLAAGSLTRSVLVGPLTAVVLFGVGVVSSSSNAGLTGLLRVGGSTGSVTSIQRTPASAIAVIAAHLCLAALFLVIAVCRPPWSSSHGPVRVIATSLAGVAVCAGLVGMNRVSAQVDPYGWIGGPDHCSTGIVTVCGSVANRYVTRAAQTSLSEDVDRLHGSGIDWQRNYLIPHGHRFPADVGYLELNPADVHNGTLPLPIVASGLANPRLCEHVSRRSCRGPRLLVEVRLSRSSWPGCGSLVDG